MEVKLSVVIITLNEEKNIERCLKSILEISDDILVVDSFSTDKTEEICQKYGVRFIQNTFLGHIEQKNFAITQAKYPHILSLDADEALDEKLKNTIIKIKNNWEFDGYYMNRLTNYCGQWIWHCGWYPDKKLRLWDSRKGQWEGNNPHDKYEMFDGDKTTVKLKGNILHYSYYSVDEHIKQTNYFAEIMAKSLFKRPKKSSFINRFLSPAFRFFRDYILLLGFLDGKAGLTICKITSFGTYLKYRNLKNLWISNGKTTKINDIKTIIISRTDAIGDVILTLPICGIIKKYYPESKIIFLGRTYTKSIIEHCEHVDEFLNADTIFNSSDENAVKLLSDVNADAIIHVYPNRKIAKFAKNANIKYRIGTTNRIFHFFNVNKFIKLSRRNSDLHESQLNCKLLKGLEIEIEPNLSEMATYTGFTQFNTSDFCPNIHTKNIILHPKSNASAREWSLENFSKLIQVLPKEDFTFYISGTEKEKEILSDWLKTLPDNVIDLTGKYNLNEFIEVIAKVDFLVAASTGPLHIAAALGIGAIGIYPPIRPIHPGRWKPIGKNALALSTDKVCKVNCLENPNECSCMNLISANQVASIIFKPN